MPVIEPFVRHLVVMGRCSSARRYFCQILANIFTLFVEKQLRKMMWRAVARGLSDSRQAKGWRTKILDLTNQRNGLTQLKQIERLITSEPLSTTAEYNALLKSCVQNHQMDYMFSVLEEMVHGHSACRPNDRTFSTLLRAHMYEGPIHASLSISELFSTLYHDFKLKPVVQTFEIYLEAMYKAMPATAVDYEGIKLMLAQYNYQFTPKTFTLLLLHKKENWEGEKQLLAAIEHMVETMIQCYQVYPDIPFFNAIVKQLEKHSHQIASKPICQALLQHMKMLDITVDPSTILHFLSCAHWTVNDHGFIKDLEEELYVGLLEHPSKQEDALLRCLNSFIMQYCKVGRMEAAEHILVKMKHIQVRPDAYTFSPFLQHYAIDRYDPEQIRVVLGRMEEVGVALDAIHYRIIMKGHSKHDEEEALLALWREYSQAFPLGAKDYGILCSHYSKGLRMEEVEQVIGQMNEGDIDAHILRSLFSGYLRSKQYDKAYTVLDRLQGDGKRRVVLNKPSYDSFQKCLLTCKVPVSHQEQMRARLNRLKGSHHRRSPHPRAR